MALVTLSGVISAANLNTNFSDKTATILSNMKLGHETHQLDVTVLNLTSATAESLRTLRFTPPDDVELQWLRVSTYSTTGSLAITATLTCPDSNDYLLEQTVSATATTSALAYAKGTTDFRTSPFIVLKKGIEYLLTLSSASASVCELAQANLGYKVRRRYQ